MFKFVTFNEENETQEQYFNRMAQIVNAIRTGAFYDGMYMQAVYTDEALAAIENKICENLLPTITKVATCVAIETKAFHIAEDITQAIVENTVLNLHKFNNPSFRKVDADGNFEEYTFGNFIRFCAKEPVRDLMQNETGYTKRLSLMLRKISKTEEYIMKLTGAHASDLTPEIIAEYMWDVEKNPLTADQIKSALALKKVFVSVDAEEDDNKIEPVDDREQFIIEDEAIDAFLRKWIDGMRIHRRVIFLQGCKFCPEEIAEMTMKEFSCEECLLNACKKEAVGRKNIMHGNVEIERQGRKDIDLDAYKDIDFVKEDHISRVRITTVKELADYIMKSGVQRDELEHQMGRFFKSYWDELMKELLEQE